MQVGFVDEIAWEVFKKKITGRGCGGKEEISG